MLQIENRFLNNKSAVIYDIIQKRKLTLAIDTIAGISTNYRVTLGLEKAYNK